MLSRIVLSIADSHSSIYIGLGNTCQARLKIVPQDLDDELRSTFDSKLAECPSICVAERKLCDHTLIGHRTEVLCDARVPQSVNSSG